MIKFTNKDNNKQFISIEVKDSKTTATICESLKEKFTALQHANIIFDDSEILIEIDNNINYGFSLNELREYMKTIAAANVTHFSVDTDEPTQRYNG